jgi:NitT/TauT family transport system substrate-binding protein
LPRLTIQESLRASFYIPYYAALAGGAFAAEGLDVRFVSSPRPEDSAVRVMSGEVDVTWGGPMRIMQTYDRVPGCDLVCFCEVVTRDPFLLVGATPLPDFSFSRLAGLRIGLISEVPTPGHCLQADLNRAGMSLGQLRVTGNQTMAQNMAALRAGELDVVQLPEPLVEELRAEGTGHVWWAAANRGHTCYTTLYCRRSMIATRSEEAAGLVRAVYRVLKWVHAAEPADVAALVRPYFPDVPAVRLEAAIAHYCRLGVWGRDPVLPRSGYDRLKEFLVETGFTKGTPYEVAVDNSLARQAIDDDPPPLQP